jgi:hypothetical protein
MIQDGTLPIQSTVELYQLSTSFTRHPSEGLMLIIHVPIIMTSLDLLRFRLVPMHLNVMAHMVEIHHPRTLLAVNRKLHHEIEEELQACWHHGHHYLCRETNAFHLHSSDTCLGTLFQG